MNVNRNKADKRTKDKIICIVGPTATGKSELAVDMSMEISGEIVSADSMQLYKGMDIGTAKADARAQSLVRHHMIDILDPFEDCSVQKYVNLATATIQDILQRGKTPVVVGGTGLFVNAIIKGNKFAPTPQNREFREMMLAFVEKKGTDALYTLLKRVDPSSSLNIHESDIRRIIRTLEACKELGYPVSWYNSLQEEREEDFDAIMVGLNIVPREKLYTRINRRVDNMIAAGLIEEVSGLMLSGITNSRTAMQAIGYKEIITALTRGEILDNAIDEIKKRSRNYAKRQITWFVNDKRVKFFEHSESNFEVAKKAAISYVKQKLIEL